MGSEKYNILFIFNDTSFGGASLSLWDTLISIRNIVNPLVVIREDAPVEDRFLEAGIKYKKINFYTDAVKMGTANEDQKIHNFVQSYAAALQLLPILREEKIQLIHINSSGSYFAALAALMAEIPYVWHIRELMEEHFNCEFLNEEIRVALYHRADKLISISDYLKQKYYEKYRLETTRIYNGLDIQRFRRQIDDKGDFNSTFIAVGAITPQKGQWDVIRAMELLYEKGFYHVKVIIVGNGVPNYVWALKKYIKWKDLENNICILPYCNDLSQLREQASFAITASQCEALGRVTIEAMLAGNFVIGARSGATTEILGENEERGFLYELHDSESLADAMIRAIECPKEIKCQMIENAQKYAERTFNSENYCKTLVELYQEIIDSYKLKQQNAFLQEIREQYEYNQNKVVEIHGLRNDNRVLKAERAFNNTVKWIQIRQSGHTLNEYFQKYKIHSIAIYGMAVLGCRLYDELEDGETEIKYLLDKEPGGMVEIFNFASLDGKKLDVDAIVVTVAGAEKEIVREIKKKGYQTVIGLSEILADYL